MEETRRLLRLPAVTQPAVPVGARIGVEGVPPWMTPNDDFYLIDTAIVRPAIDPQEWTLRIHGMVDREITLTYSDLVAREVLQRWITLNCVSNDVGGDLIGNAWWSGIKIADLLAEAGVDPAADAVLQTSEDGWTCGTPVEALLDPDRNAMLAVAMNGRPLPLDHGFPVRTIVPGLYGYVSACKWVVDWEVTRFSDITAYWTERGWGERGPVKMASRVDVPSSGEGVEAGTVVVAGAAWSQHTGISAVEVAVDGGSWQPAVLGDDAQRRHLGAVAGRGGRRPRRPRRPGARHRQGRPRADQRRARRAARRRHRAARGRLQRRLNGRPGPGPATSWCAGRRGAGARRRGRRRRCRPTSAARRPRTRRGRRCGARPAAWSRRGR